ncbi:glycosyl transferase family group 2-domain-containing protein [Zopfochytrium polystomum]|nr:glycosyl transferase family group 2-domain-containing protein [Zopfochytrium polystomum]
MATTAPTSASMSLSISSVIARAPWRQIFQRLPGVWLIGVFLFGLFGPAHLPYAFSAYFILLHVLFIGSSVRAAYGIYYASSQVVTWSTTDWLEKYCAKTGAANGRDLRHDLPFEDVNHVILLPNYKENMDTLCETLDVLASHSRALTQYKVCLAMEESEAGSERKAIALVSRYADAFLQIVYTIHPVGLEGEIRGKSSNVSWAAKQMARKSKNHRVEIITVMDADTCFTEDYFTSITYFFSTATPEQRRLQMFAPSTIFDRNAKDVPLVVRCSDIMWSIAVMSNFFPSCPVRFPCSAYSISMELASSVGFWDTGAEAMGEDMHMYLKCYFATGGRVHVEPIFSPASCCNIEGNGVVANIWARFNQAKRHLWGSLDTGYALRRALLGVLAPGLDSAVSGFNDLKSRKKSDDVSSSFKLSTLGILLHRLMEAHIIVGHLFVLIIMTSILIPMGPNPSTFAISYWDSVTSQGIHPFLSLVLDLCGWLRFLSALPMAVTIVSYEKYHRWVGSERWQQVAAKDLPAGTPRVQPLGLRSQLVTVRSRYNLVDWIALPVSGFLFQCAPQVVAQVIQLWTDRLDYTVAVKPTLNPAASHHHKPPADALPIETASSSTEVFGREDLISDLKGHRIDFDVQVISPRSQSLSPKLPVYSEIDTLSPLALESGSDDRIRAEVHTSSRRE